MSSCLTQSRPVGSNGGARMKSSTYQTVNSATALMFSLMFIQGCTPESVPVQDTVDKAKSEAAQALAHNRATVLAVNIGGEKYVGVDGLVYAADTLEISAPKKRSEHIKGSQDATLFKTFREGDLALSFPLENGRYDVTFKFAEPEDRPVATRVFDVLAEGEVVVEELDVRLARDGNHLSSISRTVTNVIVSDGALNVNFNASVGTPLLHGIVVRKSRADEREWKVVWQDEFDYEGQPDPAKWSHDIWPARKVNDEDQTYTDRAKNSRVENGMLVIEAHKEQINGAEYSSARLHNLGKGDFLYGRVDVRAKVPAGQGTWSAIWMLPSDPFKHATSCEQGADWQGSATCDAWPNSGEIDILEHVGYDMQLVHGTVHNKAYYWMNGEQRKAGIEGKTVDQEFHVYSMEWTPEHIVILFDDTPYFYYKNEKSGWQAWPFDHPYHVILNLAIGGAWGRAGGPIDDSIFPVKMEIDYVRISTLQQN